MKRKDNFLFIYSLLKGATNCLKVGNFDITRFRLKKYVVRIMCLIVLLLHTLIELRDVNKN